MIAGAPMGDPNASIPTPQPVHYRPMFGTFGRAASQTRLNFVSQAAIDAGIKERLGLQSTLSACKNVRGVRKKDMKLNDACPELTVDP